MDRPTHPPRRYGLRSRFFAAFQTWGSRKYAPLVHERKRKLLADVSGTVLEIGAGGGTNFEYFPPGVRWIGVEPNPHMHRRLRENVGHTDGKMDLRFGTAEALPLPDASVDAVVSTLVLCSVDDLSAALAEIRRVLRPGGRFLFLEHVGASPGTAQRRRQETVRRFWMFIGDGCRPDRDTLDAVRAAGFSRVEAEVFSVPVPVVAPHVAGVAYK